MAVNDSTMSMALILSSTCTSAEKQAYPYDGYRFVNWNDGNTDNPRTITVIEDAIYIASFAEDVSIDAANELDALTFQPNKRNYYLQPCRYTQSRGNRRHG